MAHEGGDELGGGSIGQHKSLKLYRKGSTKKQKISARGTVNRTYPQEQKCGQPAVERRP